MVALHVQRLRVARLRRLGMPSDREGAIGGEGCERFKTKQLNRKNVRAAVFRLGLLSVYFLFYV